MLDTSRLFAIDFLRDVSPSPNGSHIAFCVSRITEAEIFEIRILEMCSGTEHRLAFEGNAWAPSWSPDGKRIAFVADGRLRIAQFPSLALSQPLTPDTAIVEGQCAWAPDGKLLAAVLAPRPALKSEGEAGDAGLMHTVDCFQEERKRRIYVVDPALADCRCVTPEEVNCSQPDWSPDSSEILFIAGSRHDPVSLHHRLLKSVDVAGLTLRTILSPPWYIEAATWLAGGERIVIAGAFGSRVTVPVAELWTVDRNGNAPSRRTPSIRGNVGLRLQHDMPGRELTGRTRIVPIGDEAALVTVQVGGRGQVWRIALRGEIRHQCVIGGDRTCMLLAADAMRGTILFASTGFTAPPELWSMSLVDGEERQLSHLAASAMADWPPFDVRPFAFEGEGAMPVEGWFVAMAGATGPLPTILSIHAGPFLAAGHIFRFDLLMLAALGYGVALANFRGSSGYGEDFAAAIMGDWGRKGFPDHIDTVDAVIARGWADPGRLGVWGTSHGGFATCWVVTHSHRFRAGLAEAAPTDFSILYYLTDMPDIFAHDLGGRPDEIPDLYHDLSPLTHVGRCQTPVMLLHALDDARCPVAGALAFHRALRDIECPTELVLVKAGGHNSDSTGPLTARRAQNEALMRWFCRHLPTGCEAPPQVEVRQEGSAS